MNLTARYLAAVATWSLLIAGSASTNAGVASRNVAITVLDGNGRPAQSTTPSAGSQTFDVTVGPGGALMFSPGTVNIIAGDTVRWTWGSSNHNVRSGTPCTGNGVFCSTMDTNCTSNPLSASGTVYLHTFNTAGSFSYFCALHCSSGMTGSVVVTAPFVSLSPVVYNGTGFVISGKTMPNRMVTIQAASDVVSGFASIGTATASGSGDFQFTDASATSLTRRFYRVIYP